MLKDDLYNTELYKPIEMCYSYEDFTRFSVCPECKIKPRVWIFNNGNFAKCCCYDRYEEGVSAEDVMAYVRRNNGSLLGYNGGQELIDNWNKRCSTLYK